MRSSQPHPVNTRGLRSGFTLIEISIAMAIVIFMILPLVSLTIHSKQALYEARFEVQGAEVADRIFSDLAMSNPRSGLLIETRRNSTIRGESGFRSIPYDQTEEDFAFNVLVDQSGRILDEVPELAYESGYFLEEGSEVGTSIARIRIFNLNTGAASTGAMYFPPGVRLVAVDLEFPAAAPSGGRQKRTYSSFMTLTDSKELEQEGSPSEEGDGSGGAESPAP